MPDSLRISNGFSVEFSGCNQSIDVIPNGFRMRIEEKCFGGRIPGFDGAVEIEGDDRHWAVFEERGQVFVPLAQSLFKPLSLTDLIVEAIVRLMQFLSAFLDELFQMFTMPPQLILICFPRRNIKERAERPGIRPILFEAR